ncbi:MAG: hypothetical protein F4Y44_10620 [Chloroflexi bacterium]|nr:hypothetical protein [Chloroflexota bacterium]
MKKKCTYKAVIRHEPGEDYCRLEWISGKPRTNEPLEVEISVWQEPPKGDLRPVDKERSKKVAKAFEKLAELGTFSEIKDPVEWQREIRKDRPLPGRD